MRGPWGRKQITIHISKINCTNNGNTAPLPVCIHVFLFMFWYFSRTSVGRGSSVSSVLYAGLQFRGIHGSLHNEPDFSSEILKHERKSGAWRYKLHVKQWEILWHFPQAFRKPQENEMTLRTSGVFLCWNGFERGYQKDSKGNSLWCFKACRHSSVTATWQKNGPG